MATQEFYIRSASETEAHGPFTQEQLSSLAEAGRIDLQTLYYEAANEQWVAISVNPELKEALFPEKKRLIVKPKETIVSLNSGTRTSPPITVDDMLAAADGRTKDTKGKRDTTIAQHRAAGIGRHATTAMLFINGLSLLLPSIDSLIALDYQKLIVEPYVWLGATDLFLCMLLGLGLVSTYPFIRFRAMLGLGLMGVLFWSSDDLYPLIVVGAGSIGIYLTTIFISYIALGISVGLGFAGLAGFAYYMLTS